MRALLTGLLSFLLVACSMPPEIKQNKMTIERVEATPNLLTQHMITLDDYQLHYVSVGTDSDEADQHPVVIFVHGTPGGWGTFATYFEQPDLIKNYQLFSIDRPGWGKSTYPQGDFPVELSRQSQLLGPLIKQISQQTHQKVLVVGHSYGGSLVPKLAADYPQYIRGVLILAGDVSPKLATARWFNFTLDYIPNFLIPEFWLHSNQEVLAIAPELAKLQFQYKSITQPISVLQGTKDELVRPENAEFSKSLFSNSHVRVTWLDGAGHIINLTNIDDVKTAILQLNRDSI